MAIALHGQARSAEEKNMFYLRYNYIIESLIQDLIFFELHVLY